MKIFLKPLRRLIDEIEGYGLVRRYTIEDRQLERLMKNPKVIFVIWLR